VQTGGWPRNFRSGLLAPQHIVVSAIAPGAFASTMSKIARDHGDALAKQIPARRIGRPEDMAGAAIFLARAPANTVTAAKLATSTVLQGAHVTKVKHAGLLVKWLVCLDAGGRRYERGQAAAKCSTAASVPQHQGEEQAVSATRRRASERELRSHGDRPAALCRAFGRRAGLASGRRAKKLDRNKTRTHNGVGFGGAAARCRVTAGVSSTPRGRSPEAPAPPMRFVRAPVVDQPTIVGRRPEARAGGYEWNGNGAAKD
jgi:hypothetical protein